MGATTTRKWRRKPLESLKKDSELAIRRFAVPSETSPGLEIASLGRGKRRELAAVGLEVDERRLIEAVETPDQKRRPLALDQDGQRRPDRVRPNRRAQRKRAARLTVIGRALAHEIAAQFMQPIEDLDPLERLDPIQRRDPGLEDLDAADRPVGSPLARTFEARRPGRADDADEREAGVERSGRFDRDLVSPDSFSLTMIPTRSFASRGFVAARLRLDRLAAFQARQELVMRHGFDAPRPQYEPIGRSMRAAGGWSANAQSSHNTFSRVASAPRRSQIALAQRPQGECRLGAAVGLRSEREMSRGGRRCEEWRLRSRAPRL